jgi:alpha-N-acetylglucosamine transferase
MVRKRDKIVFNVAQYRSRLREKKCNATHWETRSQFNELKKRHQTEGKQVLSTTHITHDEIKSENVALRDHKKAYHKGVFVLT